jgi:hypothetical protein
MSHAPEPIQVRVSRDRKLAHERLPEGQTPRPYFCRSCGAQQTSPLVPRGWYMLSRASGTALERSQRLGLYCSARCLAAQLDRIVGIEEDLTEFAPGTSPFAQHGTLTGRRP